LSDLAFGERLVTPEDALACHAAYPWWVELHRLSSWRYGWGALGQICLIGTDPRTLSAWFFWRDNEEEVVFCERSILGIRFLSDLELITHAHRLESS
jgi:hypothetical protein